MSVTLVTDIPTWPRYAQISMFCSCCGRAKSTRPCVWPDQNTASFITFVPTHVLVIVHVPTHFRMNKHEQITALLELKTFSGSSKELSPMSSMSIKMNVSSQPKTVTCHWQPICDLMDSSVTPGVPVALQVSQGLLPEATSPGSLEEQRRMGSTGYAMAVPWGVMQPHLKLYEFNDI